MTTILEGTFTEVNEEGTIKMEKGASLMDKLIYRAKKLYETVHDFAYKATDKVKGFLAEHNLDGLIKNESDTTTFTDHMKEAFKTGTSVGVGVVASTFFGFGLLGMTLTTMVTFMLISYLIALITRKSFSFLNQLEKAMIFTVIVPAFYLLGMYIPVVLFF